MENNHIKHKLDLLPEKPGCYLMKNENGTIIYVGKAKVLRNRVRSYFTGSHDTKTQMMVSEIRDFEYIMTGSNVEALILECNLIKKHRPRFNVLLKDDKSFPYLKLTNERYPRLEVVRKVAKDKARYFGPYPNASAAQETKKLLDRLYPLRKCKTLPDKVCLYYHLGQCVAPCEFDIDEQEYNEMVKEIVHFLNGGEERIMAELKDKMQAAAENLEFERAKEYRDLIHHIQALMEKQTITSHDALDRDIFGAITDKGWMCIQILHMRQGKMIERHAAKFNYYGDAAEAFSSYITQYYSENPALPKEVLLPEQWVTEEARTHLQTWLKVNVRVPKRGLKRKMIQMAEENAEAALNEQFQLLERDQKRTSQAAEQLGQMLGIGYAGRIEAFDNSNIQGTHPVSAMVVFTDGKPDRKQYRKYKIKTVTGADDVGSMREVIRRRYERQLKEGNPLPDLVVVDGGKGQLSAAVDVLENELGLFIPVCGLVKNERHKTAGLIHGDPPQLISLSTNSMEFYLLQRVQEEVHRFAVTFHRQTRSKSMVASQLDAIPGVGEKRRKALLKHFGSLKKIRSAQIEDFRAVHIGPALAETILTHLNEAERVLEEKDDKAKI